MRYLTRTVTYLFILVCAIVSTTSYAEKTRNIPILCYHNFNPTKPGSMNMTPAKLESQIKWLKDNGFNIIPLSEAVEYLQGKRDSLPDKAIVITADDGWKSQYTYLLPLARKYNIPVTLFIYPETISAGKNAMTWDELKEMMKTGLFEVQDHTYSHPNFKHEMKGRSADSYGKFVTHELAGSKKILEDKLGIKIAYLAWPFGIYNPYLETAAKDAGYEMSFTIDALPANRNHRAEAMPRYMIIDALSTKTFQNIANGATTSAQIK